MRRRIAIHDWSHIVWRGPNVARAPHETLGPRVMVLDVMNERVLVICLGSGVRAVMGGGADSLAGC